VKANELNNGRRTRNKNKNSENLKKYRGQKLSKGQRRIRKQRYFYQPHDLVRYEGKIYRSTGVQNKGAYIGLKELQKPVRTDKVSPYALAKAS